MASTLETNEGENIGVILLHVMLWPCQILHVQSVPHQPHMYIKLYIRTYRGAFTANLLLLQIKGIRMCPCFTSI